MLNFQFYQRTKVLYGDGAVGQLAELVTEVGGKKPLIVSDPGLAATGILEKVTAGLGDVPYVVYDGNEPNPPIRAVNEAYEIWKAEGCDLIIGVGGGSNMDCAKGVNIRRFNEGDILNYANVPGCFDQGTGLIMIPTTAGTGSEVSDGSILSDDNHIKQNFISNGAFAEFAILDPELMMGMPPKLTASTGIDALAHSIESMIGTLTNGFVQFTAEKAIADITKWLPLAVADGSNKEARGKMAVCATQAGYLLVYGHTCAGHSIGQTVGGYFGIPHGTACGHCLPYVCEFNAPAVPELVKAVGENLGVQFSGAETPETIGAMVRDRLFTFIYEECKLPGPKEFPYDESKFEEIAEVISNEFFQNFNPRKMTPADALEILKRMYA